MAKRFLFLDDNDFRHRKIKPHLLHDEARTVSEAVALLAANRYDAVFLDHDLGGAENVLSGGVEETGYDVAVWMAANRPPVPLVVVHSLNGPGAANITCLLRAAGYRVEEVPFVRLTESLPWLLEEETEVVG